MDLIALLEKQIERVEKMQQGCDFRSMGTPNPDGAYMDEKLKLVNQIIFLATTINDIKIAKETINK